MVYYITLIPTEGGVVKYPHHPKMWCWVGLSITLIPEKCGDGWGYQLPSSPPNVVLGGVVNYPHC